jgi:hypothetical protein
MILNKLRKAAVSAVIRRSASTLSPPSEGDLILVEWKGLWWNATVKESQESKYLVGFDRWSSQWDEWIEKGSGRIRNRIESGARSDKMLGKSSVESKPFPTVQSSSAPRRSSGESSSSTSALDDAKTGNISQRSRPAPLEIEVGNAKYLTSTLRDGRVVFLCQSSGELSWSVPLHTEESPLPKGFVEAKDLDGISYFFNTKNKTSQYDRPMMNATSVANNMRSVDPSVPSPWEAYFDRNGRPYYSNTNTGEVRWDVPSAECEGSESGEVIIDNAVIPDGWEVHYTHEGRPYYHCAGTGESRWTLDSQTGGSDDRSNWWESEKPKKERTASAS